ncbi:MAG: lmo0937 family membrane protein [Bacteroidetes bacterium]|nr:lmo0937 family membrane protein [Bacteroidota bacterium]
MKSVLYLIAVILIVGWIFGFFISHAGNFIHILLLIAIVALVIGMLKKN